jgi:hypothetical protein
MVSRVFVFGCALIVMALAAQRAQADPKPEAPPQTSGGSTSVHPDGWPSATSTPVSTSTSTQVSPSTSTTPAATRTPVAAASVRVSSRPPHMQPRRHNAAPPRRTARHQPPTLNSGWPDWLRNAARLNELSSVGRSSGSSLLFAAGIALLLLVIAEASFLGLAGSRRRVVGAPEPTWRPPADEPLAIRPVQLRR